MDSESITTVLEQTAGSLIGAGLVAVPVALGAVLLLLGFAGYMAVKR